MENGFGDDPDTCAETILLAAAAGLVGGSIEDATGRAGDPIYAYDQKGPFDFARTAVPYAEINAMFKP